MGARTVCCLGAGALSDARPQTGFVRFMSARWWFENRETGDITIAQFPNWPLWGIGIISLVTLAGQQGSVLETTSAWARTTLWVYWGTDELIRGVNPWRRVLGSAVVIWQGVGLLR